MTTADRGTANREAWERRAPALAALRQLPRVTASPAPAWALNRGTANRGTVNKGLAYEKRVGQKLSCLCADAGWVLWDHQWFQHEQDGKVRYFQPDFIIERPGQEAILAEVKLTYVDTAEQLRQYLEYLKLFGMVCFPITIVRNLTPAVKEVISEFDKVQPNSVLHLWL